MTGRNCFVLNTHSNSQILNGYLAPPLLRGQLKYAAAMLFFSRSTSELFSQLAMFEPFLCRFQPSLATSPHRSQTDLTEISHFQNFLPVFFVDIHQEARTTTITKSADISTETPFQLRV